MLTRCPSCATVFRVSTEQLGARQGKVRCGRCATVFNALQTLLEAPAAASEATPNHAPVMRSGFPMSEAPPAPPAVRMEPGIETEVSAIAEDAFGAGPEPTATGAAAPLKHEAGPPLGIEPGRFSDEEALATIDDLAEPSTGADDEAPPDLAQDYEPAESRVATWLWACGALLMLAILALQAAYLYRAELAFNFPALRPQLTELCAALQCDIPLPRRAELVSIEASDLHPDPQQKSRLVLVATLKNRATYAQDYPHLELTLTDSRDQPVARRVFAPREYLLPGTSAAAGFVANSEVALSLIIDVSGLEPTGYRVYVFYP